MKSKLTVRRKPMKNRSRLFLIYTAAFLLCAAGVYACFIVKGHSLVVSGDGWKQHFTAFVYFGQYGRTVLRTLLTEHQLVLPQWNFSLGYGGDILTTLHYYVIGDPLDLLSIACPTRYAVYLYSFLSLFRLYLAGLGFGAFCRYKKQGAPLPVAVGSVCYVFFTYSFLMVARHPFFALPMVYLPLLLLGVEQVLAKRRPYLLIVTVFLAAISNFYFFYMLAIITALYTLYQLICRFRHRGKAAVGKFFQITGCALLGVVLSAVVLLPVVLAFMGDSRSAESYVRTWVYSGDYYRNFLSALFTAETKLGYLTYLGYNAVAFPAICLLFFTKNKHYRPLRVVFLIATALLLIPVFGWGMNGFSYAANRWVWAYGMIVAYIVATTWQHLRQISIGKGVAVIAALAVYAMIAIPLMNTDTRNVGVSVLLAFLLVIVCMFGPKMPKKYMAPVLALVLVFTSFAGNAAYFYSHHGQNHIARYVSYSDVNKKLKSTAARKVKKATKNDDSFYRYSGDKVNYNEALTAGMNGTSFYWSLQNKHLTRFITETEQPANAAYMIRSFNSSAALNAVNSVKYYTKQSKTALPYGFTKISGKVYQNENALPLGYTTAHVITRAEYEKLSSLEKQQALLQGVVLDSVPTGMTATTPTFTDKSLPYTIVGNDDAAVEGQKLHIYKKKGSVTIQFTGSAAQETYLRFTLKDYTDYPAYTYYKTQENDPLHRYNKEKWEKKDDTQKALVKQSARKFKQETLLGFRFGYSTENISVKQSRTLNFASAYELRFDGYKTYAVNAGYSKDAKTDITVTFDARGIYDFSTLEVLEQPMTDTDRQVAKLAENTLENIQIGTDTVDGTVTLDRSKILLLTIPYCDGWTATVDGKEAQLLQANTMFSALALEPGEHTIHLTYRTPHLKAGLAVSVLGFAAFGATLLCTEVKKRKERKA